MTKRRYATIEKGRERQHVLMDSLGDYAGWTVVARDLPEPPEHARGHDGKRWQVDQDAKGAAERAAEARAIPRAELIARIVRLEERVKRLEEGTGDASV